MFSIGDTVVYGTQGVCRISEITEREICKKKMRYYVLRPVYQENNTLFVPVDNDTLTSRMSAVLSNEEIKELIRAIPDEDTMWIDDDMRRREKYREILSSSDRRAIVRVIKTLHEEQQRRKEVGNKLQQADELLLHRAETLLHSELALVLNISPEQVVPFLTEQIEIEKK